MIIKRMIRVGKVINTYPDRATVRVELPDADDVISSELPVLYAKTHRDKNYFMPDIDEHVLCMFLPSGLEQGFVIGSFYSAGDAVPVSSQDKKHITFDDGTWIEYDRAANHLQAHTEGDITVKNKGNVLVDSKGDVTVRSPSKVLVDCPYSEFTGKVTVNGLFTYKAGMLGSGGALTGAGGASVQAKITGRLQATEINNDNGLEYDSHVHGDVQPGSGTSGGPQ